MYKKEWLDSNVSIIFKLKEESFKDKVFVIFCTNRRSTCFGDERFDFCSPELTNYYTKELEILYSKYPLNDPNITLENAIIWNILHYVAEEFLLSPNDVTLESIQLGNKFIRYDLLINKLHIKTKITMTHSSFVDTYRINGNNIYDIIITPANFWKDLAVQKHCKFQSYYKFITDNNLLDKK